MASAAFWFSSATLGAPLVAACSTSLAPNSFSPASLMKLNNPMRFSFGLRLMRLAL